MRASTWLVPLVLLLYASSPSHGWVQEALFQLTPGNSTDAWNQLEIIVTSVDAVMGLDGVRHLRFMSQLTTQTGVREDCTIDIAYNDPVSTFSKQYVGDVTRDTQTVPQAACKPRVSPFSPPVASLIPNTTGLEDPELLDNTLRINDFDPTPNIIPELAEHNRRLLQVQSTSSPATPGCVGADCAQSQCSTTSSGGSSSWITGCGGQGNGEPSFPITCPADGSIPGCNPGENYLPASSQDQNGNLPIMQQILAPIIAAETAGSQNLSTFAYTSANTFRASILSQLNAGVAFDTYVQTFVANANSTFQNLSRIFGVEFDNFVQQSEAQLANLNQTLGTFDTTAQQLQSSLTVIGNGVISNLTLLNSQLRAAIESTSNASILYETQASSMNFSLSQIDLVQQQISVALDSALTISRSVIALLNDLDLDTSTNNAMTGIVQAMANELSSLGYVPFFSQLPGNAAIPALGYIPQVQGAPLYFLSVTIVYQTQVTYLSGANPPPGDPDITTALAAPEFQLYQQVMSGIVAAQNGNTVVNFINLRTIQVYCNEGFLVSQRDMWFTFQDLQSFFGPVPCIADPLAGTCNCWATIQRQRASLLPGQLYTSEDPLPSLANIPTLCRVSELPLWFEQADALVPGLSITSLNASELVLTANGINDELQTECMTPLIPGTAFRVYSTTTGDPTIDPQSAALGQVTLVQSNPASCSINNLDMVAQSASLGATLTGITLPYIFYNYAVTATQFILRQSLSTWTVDLFGTQDVNIDHEYVPYRTSNFGSVDSPFFFRDPNPEAYLAPFLNLTAPPLPPPPLLESCRIDTFVVTSPDTIPMYFWRLLNNVPTQTMNITITRASFPNSPIVIPGVAVPLTTGSASSSVLPTTTLANNLISVGYLDCLYLPCDDGLSPSTANHTLYPLVYDTSVGDITGSRATGDREYKADYIMRFAIDQASPSQTFNDTQLPWSSANFSQAPFAPPSNYQHRGVAITVDAWKAQERQTYFYPTRATSSPSRFVRQLIPDTRPIPMTAANGFGTIRDSVIPPILNGYWCDNAQILISGRPAGELCTLLESYHVVPHGANLLLTLATAEPFPSLDQAQLLDVYPKYWESTFTLIILGSQITFDSELVSPTQICPSPDQVQMSFPPNEAAFLIVLNTLSSNETYRLTSTLLALGSDPNAANTTVAFQQGALACNTVTPFSVIEPGGIQAFAIPICPIDLLQLTLQVFNDSTITTCWTWTGNLSAQYIAQGVPIYYGSFATDPATNHTRIQLPSFFGNGAASTAPQSSATQILSSPIVTMGVQITDDAWAQIAAINELMALAYANAMSHMANMLAIRIQTVFTPSAPDLVLIQQEEQTLLAENAAYSAMLAQISATTRTLNENSAADISQLQLDIQAAVQTLQEVTNAYNQYLQFIQDHANVTAMLNAEELAQFDSIQALAIKQAELFGKMKAMGPLTLGAPPLDPTERPFFNAAFFSHTASFASVFDQLGNAILGGINELPDALTAVLNLALKVAEAIAGAVCKSSLPGISIMCNIGDIMKTIITIVIIVAIVGVGIYIWLQYRKGNDKDSKK